MQLPAPGSQPAFLGLIDSPLILVAEDDFEMRRMLCKALAAAGYRVREARSGSEALRCMSALLHRRRLPIGPDCIIADVRMPGFSGLEVLEAARLLDRGMPVIVITAFGDAATHESAQRLGATAVMNKPLDIQELVAMVRRLVPTG